MAPPVCQPADLVCLMAFHVGRCFCGVPIAKRGLAELPPTRLRCTRSQFVSCLWYKAAKNIFARR